MSGYSKEEKLGAAAGLGVAGLYLLYAIRQGYPSNPEFWEFYALVLIACVFAGWLVGIMLSKTSKK